MTVSHFLKETATFLRHSWQNSVLYRFTLMGGVVPKHLAIIPTDPWPGDISVGRMLLDGKFVISNQVISMADLWMPKEIDPSAFSELHQFSWLRDLRALGDNSARRLARQLIMNWIERNQDWRLPSWGVGITGHRVANWIALYDFFCSSADDSFRSLFFKEVAKQAQHLAFTWEENAIPLERFYALKGLIYVASAFPGESYRLPPLLQKLEKEVESQILQDGGHMSRCPQTHLIVLRDLIDIRAMLRLVHQEIPQFMQHSINQMAPIVRLFRHGDGGLATFGGILRIPSPVVDMVLSLADVRGRPPERALTLGFERCVNKKSLILLNVGAKTPCTYPFTVEEGTGSLNFEWSIGRTRLVVQGDLILQTPDGKHFQISDARDTPSIQLHRASQEGHTLLDARYARQDGLSFGHRRQLYLGGIHPNLRGEDTIQVPCEAIYGIRFVLDKDIKASLISEKRGVMVSLPSPKESNKPQEGQQWRLLASGAEKIMCEPYLDNQAILLVGRTDPLNPITIQWAFCQD